MKMGPPPAVCKASSARGFLVICLLVIQQLSGATHHHVEAASSSSSTNLVVGSGGYSTVQSAVNAASSGGSRTIIQIHAGTYKEKVLVPKGKTITFQGTGYPTIVYGDTASSAGSTEDSATTLIAADYFIATGIIFKNSAPPPPGGAVGRQAVALRITGDKGAFYDCQFYGAQDTLYDDKGRHYFKNCFIQGSIDFIFGNGQSLYQNCQLNSIADSTGGSLTAQKRSSTGENTGFSFVSCTITGMGPVYLGRAWGPASRVVYIYCNMANIVTPAGWFDWGIPSRQSTVYYGQYQCTGPGASESGRVSWSHELSSSEASMFNSIAYIDGSSWVPF